MGLPSLGGCSQFPGSYAYAECQTELVVPYIGLFAKLFEG